MPVPRVLYADDSKKLLALNFIVMNKLEGSILGPLERTLDSEQLADVHLQIGRLLREFHRIGMDAFGYIGPNGIWTAYATNHAYLTYQFRRKLEQFTERGGSGVIAHRIARDMQCEHWSETLDLYRLYFVLELWCWMAEIGNKQPLDKLASDLERYSTA